MLPAYISARLLERQRAAELSEFARQLPLYSEQPGLNRPPCQPDDGTAAGDQSGQPDWMTNY